MGNFVSAPILAHYRQTATGGSGASAAVPGANGAVMAASAAGMGGAAPTAVVYFAGDGVPCLLPPAARFAAAATAFKASGGSGHYPGSGPFLQPDRRYASGKAIWR